jgi:hypothetical protein
VQGLDQSQTAMSTLALQLNALLRICMTRDRTLIRVACVCLFWQVELKVQGCGPVTDVAISGLPGWVTISTQQSQGRLSLRVWVPAGIEAFVRPPMPVERPASR